MAASSKVPLTAQVSDFINGMAQATESTPHLRPAQPGEHQWEMELAHELGYAFASDVDSLLPNSQYKLPQHPFIIIGPWVIVSEVVVKDGRTVWGRKLPKVRRHVRRMP